MARQPQDPDDFLVNELGMKRVDPNEPVQETPRKACTCWCSCRATIAEESTTTTCGRCEQGHHKPQ